MTATAYGTSKLSVRRYRRTNAELAEIDAALYDIAEAERPATIRGLFYRMVSRGLVPKTDDGVRAWTAIQHRLREFVPDSIELTFERIAVTPAQIAAYELPTRPDKTDSGFGPCVEVDAIQSPTLRDLVRDAIEQWIDPEALRRMVADKRQAERDRQRNHVDLDRDVADSRYGTRINDADPYDPGPSEPPADDPRGKTTMPVLADVLLTRSALRGLPDPEPLIDNVLDKGSCALLYGYRSTYKTFIALDWAASVATGRAWQGRASQRCRVLYVAAEGAFGFKGRVDAWETGWQTTIADGDLDVLPRPVNLSRHLDAANLAALIEWNAYGLVVLDSLARCTVGVEENSAKDTGAVVDHLYRLLAATPGERGVILGLHHAGKDRKTLRGSTAYEAGVDTVYQATRDGGVVILERTKRRDGPEGDHHELKLDPIEGTGSAAISVHRGVDKPERADKLLSTFVHHFSQTGASKAELRNVADMPNATFHRALSDLLKRGDLVNEGTDRRPFYKATNA